LNAKNQILTDIKANVSDSVLKMITDNGGTIINQFPQYRAIRALIPISAVEVIAAHPDIQFIDKAALCETRRTISEGDVAHNAPLVRAKGFTGAGVKVGVLSDSVSGPSGADFLTPLKASGDLPSTVTVLEDILPPDYGSGEGAAMLEIVYDLAPASPLYFASAFNGAASFANNIIALKNAGCKVIVDDVGYFNESPFQDDIISQAVSTVTAAGVSYFSSAGNSRSLRSGRSGTWEGDYVPGVTWVFEGYTYQLHEFAPGVTVNRIIENPGVITLFWSDALGHSANDYDLFVVDLAGNVYDWSWYIQEGAQDPYEFISVYGYDYTNLYIAVGKYSGAGRFLHLNASRGRTQYATNGETHGHATVESAFCVSAVSARDRTTPFTGAETLEWFTSDGPRRVFYYPDGTQITPGNLSSTGGYVRMKPDITAADGVLCSTPGFEHFYGTSAAAPHAAAITALLRSAKPNATPAQIRKALTKSCLPTPPVWNDVAGYGIVMADSALRFLSGGGIEPTYPLLLTD
jgi:subtilisin family serine protease